MHDVGASNSSRRAIDQPDAHDCVAVLDDTCDVAAAVCAYLIAHCRVDGVALATAVGVHPLVVESCLRHNASSVQLRRRLCAWLSLTPTCVSECGGHKDVVDVAVAAAAARNGVARRLPRALLCALLTQHYRDTTPACCNSVCTATAAAAAVVSHTTTTTTTRAIHDHKQQTQSQPLLSNVTCTHNDNNDEDDYLRNSHDGGVSSLSSALDEHARVHYRTLQVTTGQYAMSVLNSTHAGVDCAPLHMTGTMSSSSSSSSSSAGAWAAHWLGSKLYDAFDYRNTTTVGPRVRPLLEVWAEAQHAYAAARGEEAAAVLLARHPVVSSSTAAATAGATASMTSSSCVADVAEYVRVVSTPYYTNRKEGQRHGGSVDVGGHVRTGSVTEAAATVTASSTRDDNSSNGGDKDDGEPVVLSHAQQQQQPWPVGVPAVFFSPAYAAAASELTALPLHSPHVRSDEKESKQQQQQQQQDKATTTTMSSSSSSHNDDRRRPSDVNVTQSGNAPLSSSQSPSSSLSALLAEDVADYDVMEARVQQLRSWDDDVEQCLCVHVQRRSGELAAATRRYDALAVEAHTTRRDIHAYRTRDLAKRLGSVDAVLTMASLHRRRGHVRALVAVVSRACAVTAAVRDVENWVALPERDAGELLVYTQQVQQLEQLMLDDNNDNNNATTTTTTRSSSLLHYTDANAVPWSVVSRLQCMRAMPQRVAALRDGLQRLACDEVVSALATSASSSVSPQPSLLTTTTTTTAGATRGATTAQRRTRAAMDAHAGKSRDEKDNNSDDDDVVAMRTATTTSSSSSFTATAAAAAAALALDVLPRAVHTYTRAVLHSMWVAACELLTSVLIDSAALSDKDADRLLALTAAAANNNNNNKDNNNNNNTATTTSTSHSPTLEDRRAVVSFVSGCRFSVFYRAYTQLLDVLLTRVTHAAQQWVAFVLGALHANTNASVCAVAAATVQLLAPLCTEAELLLALMIEARGGGGGGAAPPAQTSATTTTRTTTTAAAAVAPSQRGDTSSRSSNGSSSSSSVNAHTALPPREMVRLCRLAWTALPPLRAVLHNVESLLPLPGMVLLPTASSSQQQQQLLSSSTLSSHGNNGNNTSASSSSSSSGSCRAQTMPLLGLALCRAIQRVAKIAFRARCSARSEEVRVVLESEPWIAVDAVSVQQQATVERLCARDAAARHRLVARSLEDVACLRRPHNTRRQTSTRQSSARAGAAVSSNDDSDGSDESDDADEDTDALLRSSRASRLYVSLDSDHKAASDGRVVASSLLFVLAVLREYDDALAHFPSLAFDVVTRMADVVELYDARAAALVLGASAITQGTLHTITTTHLCLASQCFAFLAELLPRMQERLLCLLCADAPCNTLTDTTTTTAATAATAATARLRPLIEQRLSRVAHNCRAHHHACLHKVSMLVQDKVDSLGHMATATTTATATAAATTGASSELAGGKHAQWSQESNEWVMTMLREAARLLRVVRPLLPTRDVHAVVVPLLGALALRIRAVTRTLPLAASDACAAAAADVLLFKANIDRFGYDVLRCAAVAAARASATATGGVADERGSGASAMLATTTTTTTTTAASDDVMDVTALTPHSSDAEVLQWFLPHVAIDVPPSQHEEQQQPQREHATTTTTSRPDA